MALYLKYGSIDGKVSTTGYDKWIELKSFQWGVGRGISSAMGSTQDREASHPSVSEITVGKEMDISSSKLLEDALGGEMNTKAEIAVCTTGKNEVKEFLRYTLTNTGLSGYSVTSGGDRPSESLSLNFTEVEVKYTGLSPELSGDPAIVKYNLGTMKVN
ncbi:MAG: type VI secretion system tube protein Hcp [Chloroflexota bacterium]